jgi:hypothetical protein
VTQWHAALAATAAAYNISSQLSGRMYAHAALAELEALTANARGARANETAVAALAAYRFFLAQFPNRQKEVDPLLARQLAGLAPGEVAKAAAVAYPAARKQALAAADNGAQEWAGPATVRGANGTAGAYAFAPGQAVSLYPQLANVSLLALGGRAQAYADKHFGAFKPPALDSTEYAADAAGVSRVGGLNSTARSPRETETAEFWVDGDGTPSVAGHFFDLAGNKSGLFRLGEFVFQLSFYFYFSFHLLFPLFVVFFPFLFPVHSFPFFDHFLFQHYFYVF